MKKVLFYIPFIKTGGLEQVAVSYLKLLLAKGYHVDLIIDFNLGKDANTFEQEIPEGINYHFIKTENVSKFIYTFRTLGKTYKIFNLFLYVFIMLFDFLYYQIKTKQILETGNYDITISFYQFLPAYLTKHKSSKHIIWLHGSVEHYFSRLTSLLKSSYGRKLNKYDYIVTVANDMQTQLKMYYPNLPVEKVKMIYNPIDFDIIVNKSNKFSELSPEEKSQIEEDYICTVSRIDENQKDIETLINAFEKLYKVHKIKEKLYIIGDGQSKVYLEDRVKQKKLQDRILFLGRKTNPFIWMKHAKTFILSSKFEGFGMVLVEAMAVDTYVIGSNCKTGPAEILNQGDCGDLFETGDVDSLASLIENALLKSDYRADKIEKAKHRITEFNQETSIVQLTSLIESAV